MPEMVSCSAVAVGTTWGISPVNCSESVFVLNPVSRQPVGAHSAWLPEPGMVTATVGAPAKVIVFADALSKTVIPMWSPVIQVVPAARLIWKLPTGELTALGATFGAVGATMLDPVNGTTAAPACVLKPTTETTLRAAMPATHAVAIRRNLLGPCFISCSLDLVFIAIVVTSGLRSPGRTTCLHLGNW